MAETNFPRLDVREEHFRIPSSRNGLSLFLRYVPPLRETEPRAGNIVLYTTGQDGPGFQFAISNDQNWIIIRDSADKPQTSCFYDQGNDVFMKFNNTVPAP